MALLGLWGATPNKKRAHVERLEQKVACLEAKVAGFKEISERRERGFFGELTGFMSSAPCVVMILEKDGAIAAWRDLMGPTNPEKGEAHHLRKRFGNVSNG